MKFLLIAKDRWLQPAVLLQVAHHFEIEAAAAGLRRPVIVF